jgi:hypothetical protein
MVRGAVGELARAHHGPATALLAEPALKMQDAFLVIMLQLGYDELS